MKPLKVVRAKRSMSIDLEYGMFHIEEGKTYVDDETTVFDSYIAAGLKSLTHNSQDGRILAFLSHASRLGFTSPDSKISKPHATRF